MYLWTMWLSPKKQFYKYYSNLYKKQDVSKAKIKEDLRKQKSPKLTEGQRQIMNGPIRITEAYKKN